MTGQNHKRRNNTSLFHFITIVICARQTTCLYDNSSVEPTMSEHLLPDTVENGTCGKESHDCRLLCGFCDGYFSGNRMDCFLFLLEHSCLKPFNDTMNHNITDWCDWSHVSGLYSSLSVCTEDISDCMPIPWPNPPVETMFLDIHSRFFQDCPSEELSDPPPAIIFALVITPICLIPLMVSLVVLKTKNGDGSP